MLRRRFVMTGEEKPTFTITYYAPLHIPFFGTMKNDIYGISDNNSDEYTKFNVVLDTWENGVGTYGIKITEGDSIWYNKWIDLFPRNMSQFIIGSLGTWISVPDMSELDYLNTITDIIFSSGITLLECLLIGDLYLNNNTSVTLVTLPNTLEVLGDYTLRGLEALKSITIPDSVIKIGSEVLCIGDTSFNKSLEEIVLKPIVPPSTTSNPINIFSNINPNFKIRVYADCIDTYKNDAVWGQYNDLYDTINNAIVYYTEDGSRKIYEQPDNITITPDTATDVKRNAVHIYLPNSITTLALNLYANLKEFIIPDSVTTLLEGSLKYCVNLEKLTINDNIIKAENDSILYCRKINTILFNNNNITLSFIVQNSAHNLKYVIIGDNVTLLLQNSFRNLSNLQEVIIPNTITIIPSLCFSSCNSLPTIQIPDGVTTIGAEAFSGCSSLTSIVIPENVASIKYKTFYLCSGLTSITIPNRVTSIEDYAFDGCDSLLSITFQGTMAQWKVVTLGHDWNKGVPATVVHCTDGDVEIS